MRRKFLQLLLFSLPMLGIIASRGIAQAPIQPYVPKNADESKIVQLVKTRHSKMIVTNLVIADRYGLYGWVNGETGGETIVKYDQPSKLWKIVRGTGGAFRVEDIVRFGVPQATAQKLFDAMNRQVQAEPPRK